jgi:hypothetical protein
MTYLGLVHICPICNQHFHYFDVAMGDSTDERGAAPLLKGQEIRRAVHTISNKQQKTAGVEGSEVKDTL